MTERKMKSSIFIVGAGQLGSRHLQALRFVDTPLKITVVDPSPLSLETARERYEAIAGNDLHEIRFLGEIPLDAGTIDIAIVATNADTRAQAIKLLLDRAAVRFMILEKLLFSRIEDYASIGKALEKHSVVAWTNCSMRTMPFYSSLRSEFAGKPFSYMVSGSQFGLVTNAIHYVDHMALLSGGEAFSVDVNGLNPIPIDSKRPGFLELTGTLTVRFESGVVGVFTCFPGGALPVVVEVVAPDIRLISRESEGKAFVSRESEGWAWNEIDAKIPYQSQMTADVVRDLLSSGVCHLTPFELSVREHLSMLSPLVEFLNQNGHRTLDYFPFT